MTDKKKPPAAIVREDESLSLRTCLCGGRAEVIAEGWSLGGWRAICGHCLRATGHKNSERAAIRAWNSYGWRMGR